VKIAPGTPLHVRLDFGVLPAPRVGRLALDRQTAVFEYDRAFIATGIALNPIDRPRPGLVRPRDPRVFRGLHGVFADSLPDSWGQELVRRRAAKVGIDYNSLTVLDQLAAVGSRGPGALAYEPHVEAENIDEAIDLDALASESLAILSGAASDVTPQLRQLGGSSGGARPKVLVAMNDRQRMVAGLRELPPGYHPWIVKFRTSSDFIDIGSLEAAYADMARAAGLDVAPTVLIPGKNGGYFATRRFDRTDDGGRRHMLSAAGALDIDFATPAIDYMQLLALTRAITNSAADVMRVLRRMIFNVLAINRDDHAKQHAFLMGPDGRWSAAPSYDLTFASGPDGEHYLAIAGLGKNVTREAIHAVARSQYLSRKDVDTTIDEVATAVMNFKRFAKNYDLTNDTLRAAANEITRQQRFIE
jgi:serine/threonine-protein kinase HipA